MLTNENIEHVRAIDDDEGANGTEHGNCKYPGDCGGGIHLNVVENSVVGESVANHNADGILLTDDYGPNAHNLIEDNVVNYNKTACGIVLPSHSSNAVSFVVNQDGSIPKLVIADPSGLDPLDRAAVAGLSMSNPLPPLPKDFKGPFIRLQFSFNYNLPSM